MENTMQIEKGDRITFSPVCRWHGGGKISRIVNGFEGNFVTVRFGGWPEFLIRRNEIMSVEKRGEK